MVRQAFREAKKTEVENQIFSILKEYHKQGLGLEALAGAASALQGGVANFAVNNHAPHAQSVDIAMRGVEHLLNNPLEERYSLEQLEKAAKLAQNEFKILEQSASQREEESTPLLRLIIIDGSLVPAA